jgi:hypothetical protein
VLGLRRREITHHLVGSVEFAAGSNHRWPEAVVSVSQCESWTDNTPAEAFLLTQFFSRLTAAPGAFDRHYGHFVNAATVELLDLLTEGTLESEAKNQGLQKGYGMTIDVLKPRPWTEEQQAAQGLLMLIPERVSQIAGPSYARVVTTLRTKGDKLDLALTRPQHEPENRKRRDRPEKSLLLLSAALVALAEEISKTTDYETIVVPTMEALRAKVMEWQTGHDERGAPRASHR